MSMKRFLAATDGAPDGEHAVAMACTLAQRAGGHFSRFELETVSRDWQPGLEWWKEPTTHGGSATKVLGLPGVEIVRHAETWGADLVVLGRHHHTREHPLQLGPTSDMVLRRRGGLTLFVPASTPTITRALFALDGSLRGLDLLGPASAVLDLAGARAFALCVVDGPEPAAVDAAVWSDPRVERARALVDRLRLAKGPCDFLLRWGDPVSEILDMIETTQSDLLVLGVRRGGAPGDLGSGHVGRDLLEAAPCAVLTVPI
jgi:nucleotide-binding universal stress UspA family protein